ncbi:MULTISPECIES: DUF2256 domain-containing protein [unclassified Guyparkeria]|uniref:DUF2256 domain-containing protein n=1 Tax=unclassified Guyparkeria TaxID=2626246 RepID=UPI0009EA1423|nr:MULTISPECIES: DUF2256 domain-containing protein [unclassified Guyparkeria]
MPRQCANRPSMRPQKTCLGCGRPFSWRRKWARDWERVRYCSERCRRSRKRHGRD